MSEELLDLVNEQDLVIGLLVNKEGRLWIPRRTGTRKIFPNALDYSVAGYVEAGESYEAAFVRETSEELNMDLNHFSWRMLGKLTPAEGAHCFQMVYEITSDLIPTYNREDFSEANWLWPLEVIEKIDGGDAARSDLVLTIKRFFVDRYQPHPVY